MVVFFEQSVVLHCPLLELHIYAAAVDADDAPDATEEERRRITRLQPAALSSLRLGQRRLSAKEAFLLHVIGDARAQFHGGRECEASGRRGRHVGLQNRFQRVQDIILAHLTESRVNTQRERRVFPICKDTFNKS